MPKNALQTEILGALEIVAGYALEGYSAGASTFLIALGKETMVAGAFQELAVLWSPSPQKQAIQAIVRSTTANMQIVYGQVKTGGVVCFSDTYGGTSNPYLCVVIAHSLSQMNGSSGLGVSSVGDVWINNIQIPAANIDSGGNVFAGPSGYDSNGNPNSPWNPLVGQVVINRYDGSQTSADSTLTTHFSNYWKSTAIGKGIAYTMFQLYRNPDDTTFSAAFPQGIPNFLGAIINGQKVYDPRADSTNGGTGTQRFADPTTWTFSSNPTLCAVNLLTRAKTDGGMGIGSAGINWPSVAAAANICDESVTLPGYGATWNGSVWSSTQTTVRYSCNVALSTGDDVLSNLQTILDCMAGHVVPSQGQLYFYAGAYDTPSSVELNEDCLAGQVSVAAVPQRSQIYNMVKGTYCEPLSDYQTIPAQPLYNATYETEDGGLRLARSLSLPGVNNQFQAQYLEIIASQQSRNKRILRVKCNVKAMQWKCWDIVPVTIAELGLSSAPYRILQWQLNADMSIDMLLQEEASTTYDFALSQFTGYTPPTFYMMPTEVPAAPSGLSATPGGPGILLSWTPPADNSYLGQTIQRAPDVSGSPGTYATIADGVRGSAYTDTAPSSGTKYWYKIAAFNAYHQLSAYCTPANATATTATSNADHTASNTSADTSNVNGVASSSISPIATLMPSEANANRNPQGTLNVVPQPSPRDSSAWGWGAASANESVTAYTYGANTYAPVLGYFELDYVDNGRAYIMENGAIKKFQCTGGETLYFGGYFDVGTATDIKMFIFAYHADGSNSYAYTTPVTAAGWNPVFRTWQLPTDCMYFTVMIWGTIAAGQKYYWDNILIAHHSRALTVAGSGVQYGDSRNLRGLTAAGVQYYISGSNFTATSTSISVPAQTLVMGGSGTGNVSYNSSSITGLSPSTTYYLYYIDPGFQGGSQTLHATTSKTTLAGNPDIVYLGYWTTPASGSGGSGGFGGCVSQSAWLYTSDGSTVQAKDASKGLVLHTMTDANVAGTNPILNDPYLTLEPAVTISTANGSITLSDMTPVNCKAGAFPAYDTLNEEVWTSLNGGAWEQVTAVTYVQSILVSRISLGGLSYGAGDQPDYFIFTHNTQKP